MNDPVAPATSSPVSSPRSRGWRVLRWLAWVGFALGLLVVIVVGFMPVFFSRDYEPAWLVLGTTAIFLLMMRWVGPGPWQRLAFGYAGLAIAMIYLARDDATVHRAMTLEEFAPAFPGAEKSYEVVMRYGRGHPLGRDFHFQPPSQIYQGPGVWKPTDPAWKTWLVANRADLEDDWAQLQPVRDWLTELNTFDRIGDLTPTQIDAEIMAFAPIRAVTQHASAIASLQAIDGHGDAAVETLLPVLEVGRKLSPSSRTLVRSMIAVVVRKTGLEATEFVLNSAEISPAARARLAAALADDGGAEIAVRKLIGVEYAWGASLYLKQDIVSVLPWEFPVRLMQNHWWQKAITPLSPLFYNVRRTTNLYGDLSTDLQDLAARRDLQHLDERSKEFFQHSLGANIKNVGGVWIVSTIVPAFSKVVEAFWKTEDLRSALYSRVKK
jgi:hypothetical protein